MSDTDIEKLPKWAQSRIQISEMRRGEAEARLAAMFPEAETDTYWNVNYEKKLPLPKGSRVRFQIGTDTLDYIDVSLHDGLLKVEASGEISVHPYASNYIKINMADLFARLTPEMMVKKEAPDVQNLK